ncbi:MAG: DUF3857 domain-containing protein [Spirochaetales bacterium]|nr:DUF3857 domain-containing protein [Spirochaetales bacterium]
MTKRRSSLARHARMTIRLAAAFLYVFLAAACAGTPGPASPGSGDVASPAAFDLTAAELLASYASVPVDAKASWQVLDEEIHVAFTADGHREVSTRAVVRVLTPDGVEAWSILNAYWQPWRSDRPVLAARVIHPGGDEAALDPSSIVETGVGEDDGNLRSDARRISAPLPRLEPGALLEYRLLERTREARPGAGISGRILLGRYAPVSRIAVSFTRPEGMPFAWDVLETSATSAETETAGGLETLSMEFGPLPAYTEEAPLLPWDEAPVPLVEYGSAASWNAVARVYAEAVEPYLDPAPVAAWARAALGAVDPAVDPAAAAKAIADAVRESIRYTGVLFGENAVIPHAPSETLAAGYGDCKDQATLLAAALRAVGIKADLALLDSGSGYDTSEAIPGLELFDHAIVRAPELDLWFDPTAYYTEPGELPRGDRLRRALVASPSTAGLVTLPGAPDGADWYRETRRIMLSEQGAAVLIEETTDAGGGVEQWMRSIWDDASREEHLEYLRDYGKSTYEGEEVEADFGDPRALAEPFVLSVKVMGSGKGWTDDRRAETLLAAGSIFQILPDALREEDPEAPRKRDLYYPDAPLSLLEFVVEAPPGFRAVDVPEDFTLDLGPATLSAEFASPDPLVIEARYRLEFDTERMSPKDCADYARKLGAFYRSTAPKATFENIASALAEEGRYREALDASLAMQALHPGEALHHGQASDILIAAGFVEDAIAEAEEAVRLEPDSADAHRDLAFALVHDPFGDQMDEGADLGRAAAEFLKAYELDPSDVRSLFNRAILFEYGNDGRYRGEGARLAEAVETFEREVESLEGEGMAERYLGDLFLLGRYGDLVKASGALENRKIGGRYLLASVAKLDGADAATRLASSIWTDASGRRAALGQAGMDLLGRREYVLSADLLLASARGTTKFASVSDFAGKVRSLEKTEASTLEAARAEPASLVIALWRSVIEDRAPDPGLFAPSVRGSVDLSSELDDSLERLEDAIGESGITGAALMDFLEAFLEVKVASSGPVTLGTVGAPALGIDKVAEIALIEGPDGWSVVDFDGRRGVGAYVRALVAEGELGAAAAWVDAMAAPAKVNPAWDESLNELGVELLRAGSRDPVDLAVAAAVLALGIDDRTLAARLLGDCLAGAEAAKDDPRRVRELLSLATLHASAAGDAKALQAAAARFELLAENGGDIVKIARRLGSLDLWPEAERALRAGKERFPEDLEIDRLLAWALGQQWKVREYHEVYRNLMSSGLADSGDYNGAAWSALFIDGYELRSLEDSGFNRKLLEGGSAAVHTIACWYGATGRYEEARAAFGELLESRHDMDPEDLWVAHGFLALSFGLEERALASFAKAVEIGDPEDMADSSALARVMIKRLSK